MSMPRRAMQASLMAAWVTLAGCASAPRAPELAPPLPAQWRHAIAAEAPAPTDLHGWWHAFGDPELDSLVNQALKANLDVAQAVERLRAARTLRRHASARYRPYLRAKTEDAIDPDASASFFVVGFDAVWELGLFGRARATRQEAQSQLDGAVADLHAAQVSLVAEVAREWLDLRAAQQREQWLGRIRDARRQQLDLLRIRRKLQLVPTLTVDQAEAALAQAEAALVEPRQAIDAGAQRLAVLLGRNAPDPQWLKPGPMPELGPWQLDATPAELLRTRPEIARAEANVLQALGEAGMAHAQMYPNLAIGGSLVWATNLTTNRRTNDNGLASVGPIIDIPLFDWGLRAAAAHAKKHELRAAVFAYRQAVLQGVAEVEIALGNLEQQRERERQSERAAQALQRVDAATAERVTLKLASPLDRADSTIASEQATLARVDAGAARGLAYVALYKALGGAPLPPDARNDDHDGHAAEKGPH